MGTGLPCGGAGHRILIENSEYWLRNYGDLAMLEVTVRRIRERWPLATVGVMTESPALVAAYFPGVLGITVGDRDPWGAPGRIERFAAAAGPAVAGPPAVAALRARAWALPKAIRARDLLRDTLSRRSSAAEPEASSTSEAVPTEDVVPRIERRHPGAARAVRESSLVVALGGGYMTDADIPQAGRVLDLLEYACGAGIPAAMVGQGLGPLRDPELRARATQALGKLPLIALRERRRGPELLESLGVPSSAVVVTGDDAIELAQAKRKVSPGNDIGVCLRVAKYSPVAARAQETVGSALRAAASEFGARLVPLIIAETPGSPDRATTVPLVEGSANPVEPVGRFVRPGAVATAVGRCRMLVTGAYHLAVFALSQGIPVVGLTSTEYYDDKFLGLADMFGGGVRLVHLDDPELNAHLPAAIRAAWDEAPVLREPLRASADAQVLASRAAFERLFGLLEETHAEHA
ncbi:polysaccharide pyruvyl transferase family protein [Nocardia sp. CDC153]|uniref:polysaccharide pyruvyl transferase family protein n=1 Tax=Nocardia sp. CDC153 TaxID=3112167 RepID=UPI002DB972C0|nr:polysaccharide pyruvyl transferase family protein [Nocardia sp. CDC153]MEC3955843.1 polysaccharide pyruvyl transferase family protein [Nocardia sp. CDC153]